MMRLFSSRRESITADLRARAAQFEQRYGRAPSQRELAHLAQASNFTTRNAEARCAGCRAAARGLGRQARADPRREPGLGRAVGLARRIRPYRARARRGRHGPHRARAVPRGAEGGRARAAGQEHLDAGVDVISSWAWALSRSRTVVAAAAPLEGLADWALRSEFEPAGLACRPEPVRLFWRSRCAPTAQVHQRHG